MTAATLATLLAITVTGPASTGSDRSAGVVSLLIALLLVAGLHAARPQRHALALSILVVGGASEWLALALVDPGSLKGMQLIGLSSGQPSGGTVNGNVLSWVALPVPICAASLLLDRTSALRKRLVCAAVAAVGVLPLLLIGSRGALIGVAVGALVVMTLAKVRRPLLYSGAPALAIAGAALMSDALLQPSFQERLSTWRVALAAASQYPVSGVGYGWFPAAAALESDAHNTYLQTLLDFGPIGFASVAALVFLVARNAVVACRVAAPADRAIARAAVATLAALGITGLVESILGATTPTPYGLITVISPVPFVVCAFGEISTRETLPSRTRLPSVVGAAILATLVGWSSLMSSSTDAFRFDVVSAPSRGVLGSVLPITVRICAPDGELRSRLAFSATPSGGAIVTDLPRAAAPDSCGLTSLLIPLDDPRLEPGQRRVDGLTWMATTSRLVAVEWRVEAVTLAAPEREVLVVIDEPRPNSAVRGTVELVGWAVSRGGPELSSTPQITVSLEDGRLLGSEVVREARPDVAAALGNSGAAGLDLGWRISVSLSSVADGPHTLYVAATDASGVERVARVPIVHRP